VGGNFDGGVVETLAIVSIQEDTWEVIMPPTEMWKSVPESQVKNVQQLVENTQVGTVAVATVVIPPPPAAKFKSWGDFASLLNKHIETQATKTPSNLDSQASPKGEFKTAPKIRRAVSCPARISNIFAANFPCLCDNWSVSASGRTVCKFGSRGLCNGEIVFGSARIPACRRCHSDRCAALYRCFQDGMYQRTKKQKLNRQARRKRDRLAVTNSSQESAGGDQNKHEMGVHSVTKVSTAATNMKAESLRLLAAMNMKA